MSRGVAYELNSGSTALEPGSAVSRRIELCRGNALTPRTACLFVCAVAAATFLVAGYSAYHGFWPVLPFAVLEIAFLIWAVRASMRSGLQREIIVVTEDSVSVQHRSPYGDWDLVFPRHWSRVKLHAPPAALHPSRLTIESHGRACEVGKFLTEDDRRGLAVRLKQWVGNVNESPALE